MRRRLLWILSGIAAVAGVYALAGAVLSARFDARIAAFRASDVHADLQRRTAGVPGEEDAVALLAAPAALLEQVPEEHATYACAEAWDPEEREGICAIPVPEDGEEEAFDPYDRRREEMRSALAALEPFVEALDDALERSAALYGAAWGGPAHDTVDFATRMLPYRARLLPERGPESADLLLRLAAKWRVRELTDPLNRHHVACEAVRCVRDVLARDPTQAAPYLTAWREMLAAEDPLALFRFQCASCLESTASAVKGVRQGEDPYGEARSLLETLRQPVHPPWFFRWYARPLFYWSVIGEAEVLTGMIEDARTEAGLREIPGRRGVGRPFGVTGVRMLEAIAHRRLAETAFAAAAGEPLPELTNPFTGGPLAVRRSEGVILAEAAVPEALRGQLDAPDLLAWEVRR